MALDIDRLLNAFKEQYGLSDDDALQVALHIDGAHDDWIVLLEKLSKFPSLSNEEIVDAIRPMLLHTPNHLNAAATLLNIPLLDTWGVGATIIE